MDFSKRDNTAVSLGGGVVPLSAGGIDHTWGATIVEIALGSPLTDGKTTCVIIPGSSESVCKVCAEFHPKNLHKGRKFTYLEDPRTRSWHKNITQYHTKYHENL